MKKVSKEKISRVYASALYDAAVAASQVDKVKKDVDFLLDVCKQNKSLAKDAASPLLSNDEQKSVWQEVAAKAKFNVETLNCLQLMVDESRISCLPNMLSDFVHLYYEGNNIAEVQVETVKDLSATQDKKLREVLKEKLNKDVVIEYVKNPALLGGLRIQYASKMFDGSLNYKLSCLENIMKGK